MFSFFHLKHLKKQNLKNNLAHKNKLIIGCGKKYSHHENIHPKNEWMTLDIAEDMQPDVISRIEEKNLKAKLESIAAMPPNGFNVIYSEGIGVAAFMNPTFHENLQALLSDDGIFIVDNISAHQLEKFKENFSTIFAFGNKVIFSKDQIVIAEMIERFSKANLTSNNLNDLVEGLKNTKDVCEHFNITDSSFQQLVPAYLYIKKYCDIDAKQDIPALSAQLSEAPTLAGLYEQFPELKAIVESDILIKDIFDLPFVRKVTHAALQNPQEKNSFLASFTDITMQEKQDLLASKDLHTVTQRYNLTIMPRAFNLGDDDDIDDFIETHRFIYSGNPGANDALNQLKLYDKTRDDKVMNELFARMTEVFQTQDRNLVNSICTDMQHMKMEKFFPQTDVRFNPDLNQAMFEFGYYMDSHYIFTHCDAICDFVKDKMCIADTPRFRC